MSNESFNPEAVGEPTLADLIKNEESARLAVEQALLPEEEGGATEAVQEVLHGAYLAAKQAREDFEANT